MDIDYHALLPELILSGTILLVLIVDVFLSERRKWLAMPLGLMGVLATLAATLTLIGGDTRVMFDGTYVVDNFALLFKVFFMAVAVVCWRYRCGTSAKGGSTRASTTSCCSPRSWGAS